MQPHCGLHCIKGCLLILPAGAASAIGMVDIHNRLLANPAGRVHFPAVTDGRGGASKLEVDAFTSNAVFIECWQKCDIDEPRCFEWFAGKFVPRLRPMLRVVRFCNALVVLVIIHQSAGIFASALTKITETSVDSRESVLEIVFGRIIQNLASLPCPPIHVRLAPAADIIWVQPACKFGVIP